MTLELKLSAMGFDCWLDQNAAQITKDAMWDGVLTSKVFLLFLSAGVLTRPFTLFEIQTAFELEKQITLMHETDARHGAFDFAEADGAPPRIAELLETHESLPWRRRRFEQDAILAELIKGSGIVAPGRPRRATEASRTRSTAEPPVGGSVGDASASAGWAAIPDTVPPLPDAYSPRPIDAGQVLDVLLGRTAGAKGKAKVLAHGMGGLGKTTLAAATARDDAVRRFYSRIGFVSAGQGPATLELQRQLFRQLACATMDLKPDATVASQRELLAEASAGQTWLVVLDDLWEAEHERQLNFVDQATAPASKVFVTTRFAKLLPGYVEVALGLLSEDEAVALLLGTAEVAMPTAAQTMASEKIVKMAGMLPLYVSMVGRLIYEFGSTSEWETEVVALLEESKSSVFGGGDAIGGQIVGSSLAQVADQDARDLFSAMAIAAEDVPMPLAALELIWCAHKDLTPPLGRLGMMKLRKHVFQLLDRNLVLGETTNGVYMHDVIREYCIRSVEPAVLQSRQLAFVRSLLVATPESGWKSSDPAPLTVFTLQSLTFHMTSGLAGTADGGGTSVTSVKEAGALDWYAHCKSSNIGVDFVVQSASEAIGRRVLCELAEEAAAAGDMRAAGLYFGYAVALDSNWFSEGGATQGNGDPLILRSLDSFARLGDKATPWDVMVELGLLMRAQSIVGLAHPRMPLVMQRTRALLETGLISPDTPEEADAIGLAWYMNGLTTAGLNNPATFGKHCNRDDVMHWVRCGAAAERVLGKAVEMRGRDSPMAIAMYSGYGAFAHPGHGTAWSFPDELPEDHPAKVLPYEFVEWLIRGYDFARDFPAAIRVGVLLDSWQGYSLGNMVLYRHGAMQLAHSKLATNLQCVIDRDAHMLLSQPLHLLVAFGNGLLQPMGSVQLRAVPAIASLFRRMHTALGLTFADFDTSPVWTSVLPMVTFLDDTLRTQHEPAATTQNYTMMCSTLWIDNIRVGGALLLPEYAADAAFRAWLNGIAPGKLFCNRQCEYKNTYELCVGHSYCTPTNTLEPEIFEHAGRTSDAIEAAAILKERFPFNSVSYSAARLVVGRVEAEGAGHEEAACTFEAIIADCHRCGLFFLELLANRELVRSVPAALPGGPAGDGSAAYMARCAAIGRPLLQFVEEPGAYATVLGNSLPDAAHVAAAAAAARAEASPP